MSWPANSYPNFLWLLFYFHVDLHIPWRRERDSTRKGRRNGSMSPAGDRPERIIYCINCSSDISHLQKLTNGTKKKKVVGRTFRTKWRGVYAKQKLSRVTWKGGRSEIILKRWENNSQVILRLIHTKDEILKWTAIDFQLQVSLPPSINPRPSIQSI